MYLYSEGLVRFGTDKFSLGELSNIFSHLTNTSINKLSPNYNEDKERIGPGGVTTQSTHFNTSLLNFKKYGHFSVKKSVSILVR